MQNQRRLKTVNRSYKLRLYGNPTKTDTMRYSHSRFLEWCQMWCGVLFFNGNKYVPTKGLGTICNWAEMKAKFIIKAMRAAEKETGNKSNIPEIKNVGMTALFQSNKKSKKWCYWVYVSNQFDGKPLHIPTQRHKALSRALRENWTLSGQCEVKPINGEWFVYVFVSKKVEVPVANKDIPCLGVDVGYRHGCADSNGYLGVNLGKVIKKMRPRYSERYRQRMKYGQKQSLGKTKKSTIKQLLDKEANVLIGRSKRLGCSLAVESSKTIANLKSGRLQGWARSYLAARLRVLSEENSVFFVEVNAAYSSQECSLCSERDRKSRDRRAFKCVKCGYTDHADLNAAKNLGQRGCRAIKRITDMAA